MTETIEAYRHIAKTKDYKEIERLRDRARHNEASALARAAEVAEQAEREKWQAVVEEKDAAHTATLAEKEAVHSAALASVLAEKDAVLAEKDAEIARLRKRLNEEL
jgi:hypothetical protein